MEENSATLLSVSRKKEGQNKSLFTQWSRKCVAEVEEVVKGLINSLE